MTKSYGADSDGIIAYGLGIIEVIPYGLGIIGVSVFTGFTVIIVWRRYRINSSETSELYDIGCQMPKDPPPLDLLNGDCTRNHTV